MTYVTDIDSHYQPRLAEGLDVALLNALLPEHCGWERKNANKRHEDLFGDEVQPGQDYYVRQVEGGFGSVFKLSRPSLDRLLVALFFSSGGLYELAAKEAERRKEALRQALQNVVNRNDDSR